MQRKIWYLKQRFENQIAWKIQISLQYSQVCPFSGVKKRDLFYPECHEYPGNSISRQILFLGRSTLVDETKVKLFCLLQKLSTFLTTSAKSAEAMIARSLIRKRPKNKNQTFARLINERRSRITTFLTLVNKPSPFSNEYGEARKSKNRLWTNLFFAIWCTINFSDWRCYANTTVASVQSRDSLIS